MFHRRMNPFSLDAYRHDPTRFNPSDPPHPGTIPPPPLPGSATSKQSTITSQLNSVSKPCPMPMYDSSGNCVNAHEFPGMTFSKFKTGSNTENPDGALILQSLKPLELPKRVPIKPPVKDDVLKSYEVRIQDLEEMLENANVKLQKEMLDNKRMRRKLIQYDVDYRDVLQEMEVLKNKLKTAVFR